MQWNSESSQHERERKNAQYRSQWIRECKWHTWFAWYPVSVSASRKAWLCWVDRRLGYIDRTIQPQWYNYSVRNFEYKLKGSEYDERS